MLAMSLLYISSLFVVVVGAFELQPAMKIAAKTVDKKSNFFIILPLFRIAKAHYITLLFF